MTKEGVRREGSRTRRLRQNQGVHIEFVASVTVADETILGRIANGLAGHASTLEGRSTAQDETPIVIRIDGAQLRSLCLGQGTHCLVSISRTNVATSAGGGENSTIASRATHDVDAGGTVLLPGARIHTLV